MLQSLLSRLFSSSKLAITSSAPLIHYSSAGCIQLPAPSIIDIIIEGILLAVPKKRTTHRKKRLRMATKWLRPMRNIMACPLCGRMTLMHHVCRHCTRSIL
ncbi:hypothetical protein SmJEL517_g01554 [Synchytrium microbalum]|uniref:Large ribosomal subunit protein bL32m n=1 Tax=Synchytrium microbalum TaxID=1806994 RepID=A0A507CA62_9FUNG|nr:uncharacterized protein SmJEL517_g01554 [Synchytrium microbalum]TPX36371.1 hypothetical protein SmJEL517_g01554 [Synchytrium microbalum]